jgi:hypothetical protein
MGLHLATRAPKKKSPVTAMPKRKTPQQGGSADQLAKTPLKALRGEIAKRSGKRANLPKTPGAYAVFTSEFAKSHKDMPFGERSTATSAAWRDLQAPAKQRYIDKAIDGGWKPAAPRAPSKSRPPPQTKEAKKAKRRSTAQAKREQAKREQAERERIAAARRQPFAVNDADTETDDDTETETDDDDRKPLTGAAKKATFARVARVKGFKENRPKQARASHGKQHKQPGHDKQPGQPSLKSAVKAGQRTASIDTTTTQPKKRQRKPPIYIPDDDE